MTLTLNIVAYGLMLSVAALVIFLTYIVVRYGPVINRIFEVRPVFLPLRLPAQDDGESVTFASGDGLSLTGAYLKRRSPERLGVLVFCHEYLSDRWSYFPYLDQLRDSGYDIFTFDFRNHGTSEHEPRYAPLQWATDHEVRDLRAALAYLRSRPDHDSAGFGLMGISRGGTTALVVSSDEPDVWGVITDGAFPTRGTMTAYILRWAEIFVESSLFLAVVPRWIYALVGRICLLRSQRMLNCRFPNIEAAVSRLSPRPWLLIHGERDAYIGPEIAREFFEFAREPKEMWIVPEAKHNRCRECAPEAYMARLVDFLARFAPRRPIRSSASLPLSASAAPAYVSEPGFALQPAKLLTNIGA
jgi:pimeloyl-ACP methyl ester carboxylesterase